MALWRAVSATVKPVSMIPLELGYVKIVTDLYLGPQRFFDGHFSDGHF